jgi:hypothetical protein
MIACSTWCKFSVILISDGYSTNKQTSISKHNVSKFYMSRDLFMQYIFCIIHPPFQPKEKRVTRKINCIMNRLDALDSIENVIHRQDARRRVSLFRLHQNIDLHRSDDYSKEWRACETPIQPGKIVPNTDKNRNLPIIVSFSPTGNVSKLLSLSHWTGFGTWWIHKDCYFVTPVSLISLYKINDSAFDYIYICGISSLYEHAKSKYV